MAKQRANWCFMPLKQKEYRIATIPTDSHTPKRNEYISLDLFRGRLYYTLWVCVSVMCRQMLSFLTFHLNFSHSSVSEKRATSEYLMLSVYLIPPFTAALFVMRVICTFTVALVSFFLQTFTFEFGCCTCFDFIEAFATRTNLIKTHFWACILAEDEDDDNDREREGLLQQRRIAKVPRVRVACHFHLLAICDIFRGFSTTFKITM